jgi:hypothetical protein
MRRLALALMGKHREAENVGGASPNFNVIAARQPAAATHARGRFWFEQPEPPAVAFTR